VKLSNIAFNRTAGSHALAAAVTVAFGGQQYGHRSTATGVVGSVHG
jgi:hypothetical protein